MIRFKKYERYKNANVNWINSIPSHWDILPNRAIFSERITKNCAEEQLLSVTIKNGVIKQTQLLEDSSKKDSSNEDKSKYKLVKINDIAYNKMRMWQGAVGFSEYQGIVSPAYIILKPNKNINSKYYHYLFRSPLYIQYSHNYSYGICDDQLSLRYKYFSTMYSIIPPIEEQEKIVQFIEYKEKQINKLIRKQKRLIELLQEKKKTIITEAVTKGLDKNAPLKDTQIDYIGTIPEHWELKKLKFITKKNLQYGANESGIEYAIDRPRYIRITDIDISKNILKEDNPLYLDENISRPFILNDGDILLARSGATVGKSFIYKQYYGKCAFAGYLIRAIINQNEILSDFVYYYTLSIPYELWKNKIFIQATIQNIGADKYANLLIPIPKILEQKMIINHIDNIIKNFDNLIDRKNRLIEKLEEYKKSLISSAVTGQIDIRDYEIKDIIEDDTIEQVEEENNLSESEVEYANC